MELPPDQGTRLHLGRVLLYGLYALLLVTLDPHVLTDFTNHVARAHVIHEILFRDSPYFGDRFAVSLSVSPYMVQDFVLAGLERVVGSLAAARIWIFICVFSIPVLARAHYKLILDSEYKLLAVEAVALFTATSWFFVMGMINYLLSVGLCFWLFRLIENQHREYRSWRLALIAIGLALGYATHLSTMFFVGTYCLVLFLASFRLRTFPRSAYLHAGLLVFLVILFHYMSQESFSTGAGTAVVYGGIVMKAARMAAAFVRYDFVVDALLLGVIMALVGFGLYGAKQVRPEDAKNKPDRNALILTAGFLLSYVLLPNSLGTLWALDYRALPFLCLQLVAVSLSYRDGPRRPWHRRAIVACAWVLTIGNLAYLAGYTQQFKKFSSAYSEVMAHIPEGSDVLPVYNGHVEGRVPWHHHFGTLVTLNGSYSPYIFSYDQGNPMPHFRYSDRAGLTPDKFAFSSGQQIDWGYVARHYEYLLVTLPLSGDPPEARSELIYKNNAAELRRLIRP